jgi:hypothetical protein
MKGGLSACKADAIYPILERSEAILNIGERNRSILFGMKNEGVVMAVGTAKVAVRQKEHGADLSWPIHERGL